MTDLCDTHFSVKYLNEDVIVPPKSQYKKHMKSIQPCAHSLEVLDNSEIKHLLKLNSLFTILAQHRNVIKIPLL